MPLQIRLNGTLLANTWSVKGAKGRMRSPQEVLTFWFEGHSADDWFSAGQAFDEAVRRDFAHLHSAGEACALYAWRASVEGRLAEIIVLDQFSRQLYRGQARAFASDPLALALAQEVVARGEDKQLSDIQRQFLYMPYMHSENLSIHDEAARLFAQLPDAYGASFEAAHRSVIERFGRYPHRNGALGRKSSATELAYIAETDGF